MLEVAVWLIMGLTGSKCALMPRAKRHATNAKVLKLALTILVLDGFDADAWGANAAFTPPIATLEKTKCETALEIEKLPSTNLEQCQAHC